MSRFQPIEPKPWHCGTIIRHLRIEHRAAVMSADIDSHRNLRALYDQSTFRRAWAMDGRLAGIAGISGTALSPIGFVWFAMTEEASRYPLAIIKESRKFLDDAMVTKRELATTVLGGDDGAKRFAVFLGFHTAHDGPGSPAFSAKSRKTLLRFIETDPDIRVPVGQGYVIPMGYHLENA